VSENNDESQTIRVSEEKYRKAQQLLGIQDANKTVRIVKGEREFAQEVLNGLRAKVVEQAEKNGIPINNADNLSPEEIQNYSALIDKIEEEREIRRLHSSTEDSESPTWQENESGIKRSHVHVSEEDKSKSYSSIEEMISDLRQQVHGSDPVKAASSQAIIDELWAKWNDKMKESIKGEGRMPLQNYEEDKATAKRKTIRKYQREGA
jgi:hypothetical protein